MPRILPFRRIGLRVAWLIFIFFSAGVGALRAQTTEVASDDFDRADGSIGTNWAYPAASETTFNILNDTVTPTVSDRHTEAYWTSNSFCDDQYSQVELPTIGAWTGVVLRADTNVDAFYLGFVFGPNDYRIYAYDGYTNVYPYFDLANGSSVTWQAGDTMTMEISGTNDPVTVTMYQNGTPVLIWRSVAGADPVPVKNGGNPGIGIYSPSGDNLNLDNWQAGNLNPDTTPPSVPANLTAPLAVSSEIELNWTASTDNVGVVGYEVERSEGPGSTNFIQIGVPTGTNYIDADVTPGATNNYLVMALDAAGNLSGSNEVTAIVPLPLPPTISAIPNQTTSIGIAIGPFPLNISDYGVAPDTLTVTATSSNTNLLPNQNLSIANEGSTPALTMVPATGQIGTSIITVTVSNGVNSTNTSFLVTVNNLPGNGTRVFANCSNIVVSSQNIAAPYPSSIDISGEVGTITNILVTVHGFNLSEFDIINALLVGPGGQEVVLVSDPITPTTDATFTLSDQAYYRLPPYSSMSDGTFQPTDYAANHTEPPSNFPSPAPAPPYSSDLSVFNGLSPNGTWSLYISDGGNEETGQIAGGWSLTITTVSPPTISGLTDQSTPVNTPTAAIPFEIGDAQTPASNLVLTVTSSNPALVNASSDIVLGGTDTNRTIMLTPEPNTIGTSTVSVIATDGDGLSTTNFFLMTVNPGQLMVTGITAANKTYDGTTAAMLNVGGANLTGQGLNGSDVSLNASSASGSFTDNNVGTNKPVQISGLTLNGSDAGNYVLTQPATTANITAQGVTISGGLTVNSKVYDGTTTATISSNAVVLSGVVAGDTANVSLSTNGYVANFASANVGNGIAVSVSGLSLTGSASGNYVLSAPNGLSANITAQGVTISSGLTANSKVYDGTAIATISSNTVVLTGVIAGDAGNVSLSTNGYVARFASANVGNNIAVSVSSLSLTGSASGNYILSALSGLAANIAAQGVTISSGLTANSKVYDGTTTATISSNTVVLSGVLAGDAANVSLSTNGYVANFASADVGNNIAVSVNGLSLTGSASGNYVLGAPSGLSANIAAQGVTICSGLTANSKVYDGTTTATISSNTVVLSGVLAGDAANVSLSTNGYVASFANANAGNNIAVSVNGLSLTGSASGNYVLSAPSGLNANIVAQGVTISSGLTANSKIYDGTATATISSNTVVLTGVVGGDAGNVSLSTNGYVASFASANVGNNIAVSVSGLSLIGSASGNYVLSAPSGLSGNIAAQGVTISSGLTGNSKIYDGTTTATISSNTVVLSGVIAGDAANVSLNTNGYVASFASANVGNNITVSVSGLNLTGSASGNYVLSVPSGLSANIAAQGVTVNSGLTANSKEYDGTATAMISSNTVVLSGVIAGDAGNVSLSTNGYVASFASADVGNGLAVSVSGLSLTGSASGNYALSVPVVLSANITPVTLTASAVNTSRTYGLPNPPLTASYSGFVNGEGTNVLSGAPGLSTSATAGSPPGLYTITVNAGTLMATNYSFNFVNGTLTVVAQPGLNVVALNGSQFVLTWPTIPNQTYQLDATTNLDSAAWAPAGGAIAGTGNPVSVTNMFEAFPQQFFKLLVTQ